MNAVCPTCGLRLARDEGYFTGAMIFSYTFAVPLLAALTWGLLLIARWPLEWALAGATLALLAFVPGIFRYSRIVWIYLDRVLDPEDEPD